MNKIKAITKKKKTIVCIIGFVIVIGVFLMSIGNYPLETNRFNIKSERIPEAFDGFRIVQVSDLHNTEFGENNKTLLQSVFDAEPDIIVITGDIIDSRITNISRAVHFADKVTKFAPTYYVNGNHESRLSGAEYKHLITRLADAGVTILKNASVDITIGNESITLVGLTDTAFYKEFVGDTVEENVSHRLMSVISDNDNYKVLLAHRPEYFSIYAGKVDLVLSGHAHGGQFQIPFVGGLFAPGQGFFPEYFEGSYIKEGTEMVVSRGVGNSVIPFRINNKPEIIIAELTKNAD